MTEDIDMHKVMFICGAQVTNDGDWLPDTFRTFSRHVEPEDAVKSMMERALNEMIELDMSMSTGVVEFTTIRSWQEWAELDLDDSIKMRALAGGIVGDFMTTLAEVDNPVVTDIAATGWVACEHGDDEH